MLTSTSFLLGRLDRGPVMMGFSVKTLWERLVEVLPRALPPVTSRSLLEGILTVRKRDLMGFSALPETDRVTVTSGAGGTPRVDLVRLGLKSESMLD